MEIATRRFLLRDFVGADRLAFLLYQANPRIREFYGPGEARPAHAESLFELFQAWASERPRRNYQLAIVQRREPFALVGCCGLRCAEREADEAQLGIELAPNYWGRYGYAVEVGRALLEFGFGELGLEVISGSTVSANARVVRVAEWFGAQVHAIRSGPPWMSARNWKVVEWRIRREEWELDDRIANRLTRRAKLGVSCG